jgi:hypothetical protein
MSFTHCFDVCYNDNDWNNLLSGETAYEEFVQWCRDNLTYKFVILKNEMSIVADGPESQRRSRQYTSTRITSYQLRCYGDDALLVKLRWQ